MSLYRALGGEAAVVELAVLTSLRVAESPLLGAWRRAADHLLLDDEQLAAYWTRVLGGPEDHPYDGPLHLVSPSEHDDHVVDAVLEAVLAETAREQVLPESPRLRAVFGALLAWDLAEARDHRRLAPTLPLRVQAPLWGWDGPEDPGSLARQAALLDRLRSAVLGLRRRGDPPFDCRLCWVTRPSFDFFVEGGGQWAMTTELVLTVAMGEDAAFDLQVRPWPDADAIDHLVDTLGDWISTDTGFGWGRERPDPQRAD